jgi:hypothetical protein
MVSYHVWTPDDRDKHKHKHVVDEKEGQRAITHKKKSLQDGMRSYVV